MGPWSTSDLIRIRAFVSNCGYSVLLTCLICYPGATVPMIDGMFAWTVTGEFGLLCPLLHWQELGPGSQSGFKF